MITITNLTPKQKMLLDIMWEMEDQEKVNAFIMSLPYRDRVDACGLMEIAISESMELVGGLSNWETAAKNVIDIAQKR